VTPLGLKLSSQLTRKIVSYKAYEFINWNSRKAVDIPNISAASGTKMIQYTKNGTNAQRFIAISTPTQYSSESFYDMIYLSVYANIMLDVQQPFWFWEDGNANGRKLQTYSQDNNRYASYRSFYYNDNELKTANTGYTKSIHVENESYSDFANLVQWGVGGGYNCKWDRNYVASYYFNFYLLGEL
jgi:hypothetical protein